MEILLALAAALLGLALGGVLNALADDLPMRRAPGRPHYPDGTPRAPSAWLGITAFLTGQREPPPGAEPRPAFASVPWPDVAETPAAGEAPDGPAPVEAAPPPSRRLSWRYPLAEIALGLAFGAMALAFRDERSLPIWMVYVAALLLVTVIDIEHRLILFVVIVPASIFALIVAAVAPPDPDRSFGYYAVSGLVGFAVYFLMFLGGMLFSAATQPGAIAFGFGDVMLGTLSAIMLGWRAFIFAALITVFAGAVGALLYIAALQVMRRRHRWFTPLPYGPYIVIGTLIMLLFREQVQDVLMNGF
ncbi:MAG: A24 family peptidase [Chloroflexota bacterium]|nr:A24 family peptidase [Anaerolineae bacterium]HMM27721.1 A24 family peptidase [Aggregatilineaceae bacterium]